MTVNVPQAPDRRGGGARKLQDEITALGAGVQTAFTQQRKQQQEISLVHTLLDEQRLNAAAIIAALPVTIQRNALYAKIVAQNALITAYGGTPPKDAANLVLDQLQRQLVSEEMSSGARTAASILSGMAYIG